MDDLSKPKATLVIKVMEHGTITGADGDGHLEFDDCINAVNGLIDWMARSLAEINEADRQRIGVEILTAALYSWTFDRPTDASDEADDLSDEDDLDDDLDDDFDEDEDDSKEFPAN